MKLYTIAILLVALNSAQALNILGIFPYQGKSHFIVFSALLKELANRGHNVTIISHFPEKIAPKNYYDISLAGGAESIEDAVPPMQRTYLTILLTGIFLTNFGINNCEMLLANKDVQSLIEQKPKFDVVLVEQFNSDCALGIAYKLEAPVVGITSHILMPYHFERFGIPSNPAYVSFHFLEGGTKPTLMQRLERVVFGFYFKTLYSYVVQWRNQNTLAKYFDDIPPLEELGREIKFLLIYHNFILTGSQLFPANVIEVGGYHVDKAKPLTGDLQKFVEEAKEGVIYINFGSLVKSSSLPSDKLEAILEAMNELPQRFIWKWENETLPVDKNKLYSSSWLPQIDILGHSNTLAFFSHAGMGGTTESLHFGVPMLVMPIFGDQPANAAAIEESGLGIQLEYNDLNKKNLVAAFKTVLSSEYRERAQKLSNAWRDRPISPMDNAIFWIEYAAKYPNFTFRSAAADVPTYSYLNLDLALILLLFISSVFLLFKTVCCRKKTEMKPKVKSKKSKRD